MRKIASALAALLIALAPVAASAATLYFNAAVDNDWATLGNWWQDAGVSVPAAALPASGDDVVVTAAITSNTGDPASVASATFNGNGRLGVDLIASVGASFNNLSYHSVGTLTASTTFTGDAHNHAPVVGATTTFNGDSYNQGAITGGAAFLSASQNRTGGSVSGYAIFLGSSQNKTGASVAGNATFSTSGGNLGGTVAGHATFGGTNTGTVGSADFTGSSINNSGTVTGDATFSVTAENRGGVGGDATFSGTSVNRSGSVTGDATFEDSSYNLIAVLGDGYFYDNSYNSGTVSGNGYFFGNAYNEQTVSGDARFLGATENRDAVTGDACFAATATNSGTVGGAVSVCDETAPTLSSAAINGATLVLTYGEALDSASTPATSAFTVTVDGSPAVVSSVAVSGSTVTLTIASAVTAGQSVTVTYAVPGSGVIQDTSGNDAPAINPAEGVANATAAEDEDRHSSSGRRGGGGGGGSSSSSSSSGEGTAAESARNPADVPGGDADFPYPHSFRQAAQNLASAAVRDLWQSGGSHGRDVRALQIFLNTSGFTLAATGPGSPGQETDFFGSLTRAALARWQAAHGVAPAVGYYGPITRAAIAAEAPGL